MCWGECRGQRLRRHNASNIRYIWRHIKQLWRGWRRRWCWLHPLEYRAADDRVLSSDQRRSVKWLPLVLTACSQPMMMTSHVGPSVQIDGDGLTGGEVAASYAFSGFGLAAHAFAERLERTELDVTRRST